MQTNHFFRMNGSEKQEYALLELQKDRALLEDLKHDCLIVATRIVISGTSIDWLAPKAFSGERRQFAKAYYRYPLYKHDLRAFEHDDTVNLILEFFGMSYNDYDPQRDFVQIDEAEALFTADNIEGLNAEFALFIDEQALNKTWDDVIKQYAYKNREELHRNYLELKI